MKKPWDRGIIYWFANNSVAANLLMMVLLIGGVYSAWNMKKEMFPATSVVKSLGMTPGWLLMSVQLELFQPKNHWVFQAPWRALFSSLT